ncbi:(d)CMP kinase [Rhodovibrionaceae bacterium A322]
MTAQPASLVIAVDGPTAAGKGTLARSLADKLDLAYLDTGSLYRAVAACLLAKGQDPKDSEAAAIQAQKLTPEDLKRQDLRQEEVGQGASIVAAQPAVRAALLDFQRRFAQSPPDGKKGAVLDGRDIGTVVCPDASAKFFITASATARAKRRHKELIDRGEESIYARILADLEARDARDSSRADAPMVAAEDAVTFDTTEMDAQTVLAAVLESLRSVVTR